MLTSLGQSLKFGCGLNIIPYKWDSKSYQLSLPTRRWDIWFHRIHSLYMLCMGIIVDIRFFQFFRVKGLPASVLALHGGWGLAYLLTNICFLQFYLNREPIMNFSNQILKYVIKSKNGSF